MAAKEYTGIKSLRLIRPGDVRNLRDRAARVWLLQLLLGCCVLTLLAACAKEPPRSIDPNGKISFTVPEGWKEVLGSSGTAFSAPDGDTRGVRIQVNTLLRKSHLERLEKERDIWLASHEEKGERVLFSRAWHSADFEGVEYAHTAVGIMGDMIWHHVLATNGEIVLASHLMAPSAQYDSYRKTFVATLDSIRLL